MKKIKVLFVISSMEGGGAQRVVSRILQSLNSDLFDPQLALVRKSGPFLKDIPSHVTVIDLKSSKARFAIFKLLKLCRDVNPDIVFSNLGYINVLIALFRFLLPKRTVFIARETDIPSVSIPNSNYPRLLKVMYEVLYPKIDMIVCQCKYMKNDLINKFCISPEQTIIINNPVDEIDIDQFNDNSNGLYDKGLFNVLAVGRMSHVKGYDLLLKAMTLVKNSRIHLTILGDGHKRSDLEDYIKEKNLSEKVTLAGFQENPYKYMANADLMVSSARIESFSNAAIEGNACGVPILAFKCPGGNEEIIDEGINGWLVESGDIDSFAMKIDSLVGVKKQSEKIIEHIYKKYNSKNIVSQYEKLFLKVANIRQAL
ncbi:MAG: glycosyltransferase [Desulfobacteraceae bacterium]|nr:glycosyltransferase [Desulfobacteraceae bacterium]